MNTFRTNIFLLLLCTFLNANAALVDRGNGMIYDSAQEITWLQDANTLGSATNWANASSWADNLEHGGYNDWRLPSVGESPSNNVVNGESVIENCPPGVICRSATDYSETPAETSGLFYTANYSNDFSNIQPNFYWLAEEQSNSRAWRFSMANGHQNSRNKTLSAYAWAVRDGDITAVPLPSAAWLLLSALGGLFGISKKYS